MSNSTTVDQEHAARFKSAAVAKRYKDRPPYHPEIIEFLCSLLPEEPKTVLDAGCGPGKIARALADKASRIDAIDFSEEMILAGKQSENGDHPVINWHHSTIEDASLDPPYGLIVAGASLHWMNRSIVLPMFHKALALGGYFVVVDGDGPCNVPWTKTRKELIKEFSTNQNYVPVNLSGMLKNSAEFTIMGQRSFGPYEFSQSLEEFLNSEHSRASLSEEGLGEVGVREFNEKMSEALQPFIKDGVLRYEVETQVIWSKPRVFLKIMT